MRMRGANGDEGVCNTLRQKSDFKVNGVSSGVGRLLGETWMGLLQSLETRQGEPCVDV